MFINRHNMRPYKTSTILWMDFDWKPALLTTAFLFLPYSSLSSCPGSYLLPLEDETMKKLFSELCLHWEARSTKQPESISLFRQSRQRCGPLQRSLLFWWRWVVREGRRGSRKLTMRGRFHHGKGCGGGESGVELAIQESNTGQRELSNAIFGSYL